MILLIRLIDDDYCYLDDVYIDECQQFKQRKFDRQYLLEFSHHCQNQQQKQQSLIDQMMI